ncbi:MAG: VIT1/CCC1 transporter family protein [Melioribacter sp.]|uniref:VIT1/CCC1 transporter family protein n=1 Tax=Rosettibacter primus TaxID=3111523 RepID=UPI00247BE4EB|nr:VIT1/CCC1 transporter family protein [Melioribacter sp.]
MIDNKTKKIWKKRIQEEVDAAFLYHTLCELVSDEKKKSLYKKLASIEEKHISIWIEHLNKNLISVDNLKPTLKARLLSKLSRKYGSLFLSKLMLREESSEVKSYLNLYKNSRAEQTKDIALKLARDSAAHAKSLMVSIGEQSEPWHTAESGGLIRNIVYGFNDGLTANFGLIAGVIGASAQSHIILISGIAGMIADALSMGSSGYLAAMSEKEVYEHEKAMESEEIKLMPELETEELALIYEAKGIDKDEAMKRAIEIMQNPEQALEDKMHEELGLAERNISPFTEGWVTGLATAIGALIPIFPFFFLEGRLAIWTSFVVSMLMHFAVGAARSFFTGRGIFRSGFDMFVVGFGVAVVGYFIGDLVLKILM